jgi:hypothetical protein
VSFRHRLPIQVGIGIGTAVAIEVGYSEYWQNCCETESDYDTDTDSDSDSCFFSRFEQLTN